MERTYIVPRDIDVESFASSFADHIVIGIFGSREEFSIVVAMQRHIQHILVRFEHALGAIAMMNVPVDNQNSTRQRQKDTKMS